VERSGLFYSGLAGWAAAARGVIDFPVCANLRPGLLASECDIWNIPHEVIGGFGGARSSKLGTSVVCLLISLCQCSRKGIDTKRLPLSHGNVSTAQGKYVRGDLEHMTLCFHRLARSLKILVHDCKCVLRFLVCRRYS
jgi:hypothetical protein